MRMRLVLAFLIFLMGYVAGEQQVLEEDQTTIHLDREEPEVIDVVEYKWKVPEVCIDTINYAMGNRLGHDGRYEEYRDMAQECFAYTWEKLDGPSYDLPEPEPVVIPEQEEEETEYTEEDAYNDCMDEVGGEAYCDEHYEDWLLG